MNNASARQRGSALVETTILMVVMLPLVYAVAMIGKLIDLKQNVEQASRYAAWEATVYPASGTGGSAPQNITQRFFGSPEDLLQSHAVEPGNHSLWGLSDKQHQNHFEANTQVVIDQSSIQAGYRRDIAQPTTAMRVGQLAGKSGEVLDGLSGNAWGLSADGLLEANVSLELNTGTWLNAGAGQCGDAASTTCLNSNAVILVDGWSASDDSQARQRVRSLMPASALEPLGDAVSVVGNLPMFGELKGLKNAFGHVDMSVLPAYAKP